MWCSTIARARAGRRLSRDQPNERAGAAQAGEGRAEMKTIIDDKWIAEFDPCEGGREWLAEHSEREALTVIEDLLKEGKRDYALWALPRVLNRKNRILYALTDEAACIEIWKKFNTDATPLAAAFAAARAVAENDTETNRSAARSAARSAYSAADSALSADSAYSAARSAARSALSAYSAYSAARSADSAADSADSAARSADSAADSADSAARSADSAADSADSAALSAYSAYSAAQGRFIARGLELLREQEHPRRAKGGVKMKSTDNTVKYYATDNPDWYACDPKDTVAEAIEEFKSEHDGKSPAHIGRGRAVYCYADADDLLDNMQDRMIDVLYEDALDDWCNGVTLDQRAELTENLTEVFHAWLDKIDEAKCWTVIEELSDEELKVQS